MFLFSLRPNVLVRVIVCVVCADALCFACYPLCVFRCVAYVGVCGLYGVVFSGACVHVCVVLVVRLLCV